MQVIELPKLPVVQQTPEPCFDVNTPQGFAAFSKWLAESQIAKRARAAAARAAANLRYLTSLPLAEALTEDACIALDEAMHQDKLAGGYEARHRAKAMAMQLGMRGQS